MRTLLATLILLATCLAAAFGLARPAAAAPSAQAPSRPHLDVIEVKGLVDDVVVDFVSDALREAESADAVALVIQLDSSGAVSSQQQIDALAFRLAHARIPVAVWVGPSGAEAFGGAFSLVQAAPVSGVAPGTRVGRAPAPVFGASPPATRGTLGAKAALEQRVVDLNAPTLGDFIVGLHGRQIGGTTLETAEVVREAGEDPRQRPIVEVRFAKLGLVPRLLHAAANPTVAYVLLLVGLSLIVFELFTAGVGVAGLTGAAALVLSASGLGALPTRPASVALIAAGMVGYAIDVQSGAPRAWTAIGTVLLALGSVRLLDGLSVPLLVLALGVAGVALFMVAGMPAMLRSRFATPTIGRESMVGEAGQAIGAVDPEGTVQVRGAAWRARTNRATPIAAGAAVRVVGIDGLLLEVEPEGGGAKDYRRH